MELRVITRKGKSESGQQSGWHRWSEQCVLGHYRTQSMQAENLDFILKAIGKVCEQGRLLVRAPFQKALSGCRVEDGLSSAKCMELREFVILIPELSRHCLNFEPLALCLNTSMTPQMLLLRNLGTLKTLPSPEGVWGPVIDLIPALPPTCWVILGQLLPCQPLKRC